MSYEKTTKLVFLSVGDVLYENGYKSRIFGEMKLAGQMNDFDKYFVSFEKKESFISNQSKIAEITRELSQYGFQTHITPRHNRWKIDSLLDAWYFENYLRKINFTEGIIHAESIYACYMALLIKHKFKRVKIIFDMHGLVGPELVMQRQVAPMRWLTCYVENRCILGSDYVLTASNSLKKYVQDKYNVKNISSLPCLADKKLFAQIDFTNLIEKRNQLGISASKPIAVYLGGMQTWQNFPQMIDLAIKHDLFLLVITNEKEKAQEIINIRKFIDYHLVSLSHPDVPPYLELADFGLMMRDENILNKISFPTKAVEYLLSGLPIIHNGTVDDLSVIVDENRLGLNIEQNKLTKYLATYADQKIAIKQRCRQYALDNLVWDVKKSELSEIYQKLASKKIFYLVTSGYYGGAQKYNLELAKYFQDHGHNVCIGFGAHDQSILFENKIRENNIGLIKFNHLQRNIHPWRDLMAMWEIGRYLQCERPDIIHISSSKAGILGRLVAWTAGIDQIFYTAHGWVFNEKISGWKRWFYLWLEKLMSLFTDKIFCVSKFDMDLALENGFDESKLKLIYNGIDNKYAICNRQYAMDRKGSISNIQYPSDKKNKIIIGTVANFFGPKNLGLLVEIANELLKIDDNFRFVIIGDGPERKKIESKIAKYRLEKYFELTGQLDNFQDRLSSFNVFVLCSSKEGFPYILLEAGLAKVPIVASHVGGVSELIVDGETGLLCPELDKDLFAMKIMDSLKDKQKSMMMAEKLHENIINDFSLSKMQEGYEREYEGGAKEKSLGMR